MRLLPWLILATGLTTALTACDDGKTAANAGKNEAASGRSEVIIRLAHATEAAGDYPGAEKQFQQGVKQSPHSAEAQIELAEFYKRHHEDRMAIESLNSAMLLEPNNADIDRELANTYITAGEPEQALTVLDKAIAANPRNPLLYNSRGVALDQTGNYAEAQKSYNEAYDIDPAGGATYKVNLSMSYILSTRYDKAIALLRPMLDMPDSPPIVRQNLALAYGLKGESETALKLGLEDLSTSEAEENIRFYRMLAQKHNAGQVKKADTAGTPSTVPASMVKELFLEDGQPDAPPAQAATSAIESVPVKQSARAAPVESVTTDDDADDEEDAPVKKPLPLISPANDETSAPEMTPVTASPGFTLPEPMLKPDQH